MGIAIAKFKFDSTSSGHVSVKDDFATDANGRLLPAAHETFEYMPLGSLDVLAFTSIGSRYNQNPYTMPGMRWETGFSDDRVVFFSPQTNAILGGIKERSGQSTMGFYYYNELRSLSLAAARDVGGPYASMVFIIQATKVAVLPIGVRVHGTATNLRAFTTMLVARFTACFERLRATIGLDTGAIEPLFEQVNGFDFGNGIQTDFFITATENTMGLKIRYLQDGESE
ncbi:MAG: hypothetical protein LBC35_02645 [Coriobacteriales bacterium]|jgi:hypothetical protein|nr:hypothetical protein [Coriobacteriales bacterium]